MGERTGGQRPARSPSPHAASPGPESCPQQVSGGCRVPSAAPVTAHPALTSPFGSQHRFPRSLSPPQALHTVPWSPWPPRQPGLCPRASRTGRSRTGPGASSPGLPPAPPFSADLFPPFVLSSVLSPVRATGWCPQMTQAPAWRPSPNLAQNTTCQYRAWHFVQNSVQGPRREPPRPPKDPQAVTLGYR